MFRRLIGLALALIGVARDVASPWLTLLIRLWLAQAFAAASLMAMMQPAVHAESGLIGSAAASHLGLALQAACPLLLALGLLTRPAAMALIVQTLVLRLPGGSADAMLYGTALLGWLTWHGLPGNVPSATGARRAVMLGRITHG